MLKINHINVPWKKKSKQLKSLSLNESLERHSSIEILYMLSGERIFYYDDNFYQAKKGDIFFILPNIRHSANTGDSVFRQLWLWPGQRSIWGSLIVRDDVSKKRITVDRHKLQPKIYCPWIVNLLQNGNEKTLPEEKLLGLGFLLISDFLNADQDEFISRNNENLPDKQRGDIAAICQYMENCSGERLSVSKLAKLANYSQPHFARLFRQHTGMTVHAKINQLRIKKMKEMERMHYSVKVIANALGLLMLLHFVPGGKKSNEISRMKESKIPSV